MITIEQKKAKKYMQPMGFKADVIDVDLSRRTVSGIGNTYNFIDHDMDMLVMGASARSIGDRGPDSQAKAKIQHLKDHIMRTDFIVGKFTKLEETTIDGRQVLAFESEINDPKILELYQSEVLNQHSIGFRYVDIALAWKASSNEDERKRYEDFIARAINPEVAPDYFYVVKEIELFEISSVVFGSNSQTEMIGIKSKEPASQQLILMTYLDAMKRHLHNNKSNINANDYRMAELNIKQFEQAIIDIANPPVKEALAPLQGISEDQKAAELFNLIKF